MHTETETQQKIRNLIRTIPNYPKDGVMFRDITTLVSDAKGFQLSVTALADRYSGKKISKVAGIEARGFIFGAVLAEKLRAGFVPIRKKGKLPGKTLSQEYELEYGKDTLEIHVGAVSRGDHVLLVDDLLATGGTATAAANLIGKCGGSIYECCFLVDLPDLRGRDRLEKNNYSVFALCTFSGE